MPFGSYETEKTIALPTLKQYCKTAKKTIQGKTKFAVELVWLPGKFDNVTLQTHAFRVIVNNTHPLYNEVLNYFKIVVLGNRYDRLDVTIDDVETASFSVSESTRCAVEWSELGSNGRKAKDL